MRKNSIRPVWTAQIFAQVYFRILRSTWYFFFYKRTKYTLLTELIESRHFYRIQEYHTTRLFTTGKYHRYPLNRGAGWGLPEGKPPVINENRTPDRPADRQSLKFQATETSPLLQAPDDLLTWLQQPGPHHEEDNIKLGLKIIGCGEVDFIHQGLLQL